MLLIMADDQGYGVSGTFGGVIPTPAMDRIARAGLRYTQFHSTALCSPSRAALITGCNHHAVGFGIADAYKGTTVFILDDPDGVPWVMQAYSTIVDPNLTIEDLKTLDKRLKLPPGWKYRAKVLDQDLEVHAINGVARIMQDDLEGTYNACFEEAGQKACSIMP